MRINVYAEEMPATPDVAIVEKDGHRGLRVYLEGGPRLHQTAEDDDRSAITFWGLAGCADLVQALTQAMLRTAFESEREAPKPVAVARKRAPKVTATDPVPAPVDEGV